MKKIIKYFIDFTSILTKFNSCIQPSDLQDPLFRIRPNPVPDLILKLGSLMF